MSGRMYWPVLLCAAWMAVVAFGVRSLVVDGNWIGVPVAACFLVAIGYLAAEYLDVNR